MRKFLKWYEESGIVPRKSFKVSHSGGSLESGGEEDDLLWTENLSNLKQLPLDVPVLLKQIKWK